jgi:hypothetical protein
LHYCNVLLHYCNVLLHYCNVPVIFSYLVAKTPNQKTRRPTGDLSVFKKEDSNLCF